jgi:rare lipoprotein A
MVLGCSGDSGSDPKTVQTDPSILEQGIASWYGEEFHGRKTASGEVFDMTKATAAHRTLPFGTMVEVTNVGDGRRITVRINDRGPFVQDRIIDLSKRAASDLGMLAAGVTEVALRLVSGEK